MRVTEVETKGEAYRVTDSCFPFFPYDHNYAHLMLIRKIEPGSMASKAWHRHGGGKQSKTAGLKRVKDVMEFLLHK